MWEGILTEGGAMQAMGPWHCLFCRKFTGWIDGESQHFLQNGFMLHFSYIMNKFAALWSASARGQEDLGGEDCHVPSN